MGGDLAGVQVRMGVGRMMDRSPQRRTELVPSRNRGRNVQGRRDWARQTQVPPSTALLDTGRRHQFPGTQRYHRGSQAWGHVGSSVPGPVG